MKKNRVLEITNELYRLTLLFPKKEPLRFKMRKLADEILANFITYFNPASNSLISPGIVESSYNLFDVLDSFFEVAKAQNWIKPTDILKLQKEYKDIRQEMEKSKQPIKQEQEKKEITETEPSLIQFTEGISSPSLPKIPSSPDFSDLEESKAEVTGRQKIILEILKQKEGVQVWEVKDVFPDISKRTLRRDFRQLLEDGLVERKGDKNTTFYQLKEGRTD
jgi:hypothetical protein